MKNVAGVSFNVLVKMSRNEFVSLESLCKICFVLACDIGDVMEFIENETILSISLGLKLRLEALICLPYYIPVRRTLLGEFPFLKR